MSTIPQTQLIDPQPMKPKSKSTRVELTCAVVDGCGDYERFLHTKIRKTLAHGFNPIGKLNPQAFDWQKLIIERCVSQGRHAIFADCGLGKTLMALEWCRQVCTHTGKATLILAPLAVAEQTREEGEKFGIYVNHARQAPDFVPGNINVTNYDRLDLFRDYLPEIAGVNLDESSILKSFTGKTRRDLTQTFRETPYRLCCTATPAPNDIDELGQHAEFLGVCTIQEMLATWFINDTQDTGTWRLKKHAVEDFWRWVASWSVCISKPSDLGFPDGDFELPPLNIEPVWVDVDESTNRGDDLIRIPGMSATDIHQEMRLTCESRAKAAADLANKNGSSWICWCNTDYEADALAAVVKNHVEVRGSDSPEFKEQAASDFKHGKVQNLISKSRIFGFGLNFQNCHNVIYFPDFSFEKFYQAIRRTYRFGQKHPVNCYLILPRTANLVLKTIREKMERHETMRDAIKYSAESLLEDNRITIMKEDVTTRRGVGWTAYHGDCVRAVKHIDSDSVRFSVFSPPFADLFVYSADIQDMGNNGTLQDFMEQFSFLVAELYRVTLPGRLCAVHCSDLLATKWKDGDIELKNFSGKIIEAFDAHDWLYHCRVTIWKCPVVEMTRTKSLGLLHKQLLKDSSMSRVGSPEYVCIFRKPGGNPEPISHDRSEYPVEQWQKDASPVWMDIRQTEVLNGDMARERQDEKHICPLQLDTVNRLLRLYTNPGDLVYSPFMGIGSEGYCALKMGRRFIGSELKKSYFETACSYLEQANEEKRTLFALHA